MSRHAEAAQTKIPSLGALMKDEFLGDALGREEKRDLRPLARIIPFVRAHPTDAFLGVLFLLISALALLILTRLAGWVISGGFTRHNRALMIQLFFEAGGVVGILAVTTGLRLYFLYKLGERVVADMRKAIFRHVLTLDPSHFLRLQNGEVLSRLTTDMTFVESLVGSIVPVALRNMIILVGALIWMVALSPNLTGLVLLLIPALLTPLFLLSRRMQKLSVRAQDRFAKAVGFAGEHLGALETVQAFGRESNVSQTFDANVERAFEASRAQLRARGLLSAMMISVIFLGMLALLYQSAVAVIVQHSLTGAALSQLLLLAFFAANAVKDLSELWGQIQKASGAAERIAAMMDLRSNIAAPRIPVPLPRATSGAIEFDHVTFAYPHRDGPPALSDFSLVVHPGERIALVGPSGAGKSTVFRLLLRFYDPLMGAIRLDGVNITHADPAELRSRMAMVAQDAPLFSGSAADNIRFGREGASPAEVIEAAQAAQAEGFIKALPQGFESVVGEHAKTLSGGQRQRLAIARAFVRDAPILLLDEATSALDSENEQLVQQALKRAMVGRTTLVIAHRLATVLEADRIVVMEAGRVVEEGKHAALLAKNGLYARLARLQFGAEAA